MKFNELLKKWNCLYWISVLHIPVFFEQNLSYMTLHLEEYFAWNKYTKFKITEYVSKRYPLLLKTEGTLEEF